MNILYPAGFRRDWVDRNSNSVSKFYEGLGIGPHGATARFNYTVPVGKRSFVTYLFHAVTRGTIAAPVGIVRSYLACILNSTAFNLDFIEFLTNAVGDRIAYIIGQNILMNAGDQVTAYTFDNSTGGTINYNISLQLVEFDQ